MSLAPDQIKNQRRSHRRQHQKQQPAEIRNHNEKPHTLGQKYFRLFFRIPCDDAESAPFFKAGQDAHIRRDG